MISFSNFHFSNIKKARSVIAGVADNTPLIVSDFLSDFCGQPVFLKLESLQPTGSFKIRGALNAVQGLPSTAIGVTCCSTGNHGRGIAYAAKKRGIDVVIFMSKLVPRVKIEAIERLGAKVKLVGENQSEAEKACQKFVLESGYVEIPPFDNIDVISGQGTIGVELIYQNPEIKNILVPLSGGGLASGVAVAAKFIDPDIRVVGVSMEEGAVMYESLGAGKPINLEEKPSLADALGGGIGLNNRFTFPLCRELLSQTFTVTEEEIYIAMQTLYYQDRVIVEGSCAVTAAALLTNKIDTLEGPTVLVVSGRNVDMSMFTRIVTGKSVSLGTREIIGRKYPVNMIKGS